MLLKDSFNESTPSAIEHLVDFLKTVKESIETNVPPRTKFKISQYSDCLGETDYGISFGYNLFNDEFKYHLWMGIYLDFWKRKKCPFCVQLIFKDKDRSSLLDKLNRFEGFYNAHKKQLSVYIKNFDDYPTIGFNNKLIIGSRTDDIVALMSSLLKDLYFF